MIGGGTEGVDEPGGGGGRVVITGGGIGGTEKIKKNVGILQTKIILMPVCNVLAYIDRNSRFKSIPKTILLTYTTTITATKILPFPALTSSPR